VAKSASQSFDENERPTAPRSRAIDPNVTARFKASELETLVRTESGTRAIVTSEQMDRYMRERTGGALSDAPPEAETEPPPDPQPEATPNRERETLDAATLQRETLVIHPDPAPQNIPIDIDLSRLSSSPVRRPRVDPRHIILAIALFWAFVAAVVGFLVGRASL
jgi:hypothetical protein